MSGDSGAVSENRRPIAFISHHSSQHDVAVHLKGILNKHGIDGWIAPDDVEPGLAFDQAIIKQVGKSDLILLLFSEKSDKSRHVKRELMLAEEEEKLIYPVRIEDIDAAGLAYWLKDYQWFDWLDQRDATIERLVGMIKRQMAERGIELPPPDTERSESADEEIEPSVVSEEIGGKGRDDSEPPVPSQAEQERPDPPFVPKEFPPIADPPPIDTEDADTQSGNVENPPSIRPIHLLIGVPIIFILLFIFAYDGAESPSEPEEDIEQLAMEAMDELELLEAAEPIALTPGQWELTTLFTNVTAPPALTETGAQIRAELAQISDTATRCLTPEMAAAPNAALFLPENFDSLCTITETGMTQDTVSVRARCDFDYFRGPALHQFDGTYDANSANILIRFEILEGEWDGIEIAGRYVARQTGPCE